MLKIGSAVHTAHGPGTVTDADTVRGRTQYKVAGVGFDVWVDETRLAARSAALGDVDESNSTTLPYDYTPEHPSEMYTDEAVMSPDHDVDLDERMTPTDSVSGEHADLPFEYPGPNPDLFAKASASLHTAAPGSMRHYLQWANQAGLQPGQAEAADLYASTHGLDAGHAGQLMDNFNNQGQRTGSIRHVSHRPAGLSDKYIDLHTAAPNPQDPARQFLEDPVGTIQRTAYRDITTHGLDPRVAEYMDLVAADSSIRTAAWKDVRAKAMRLKREGAVHVKVAAPNRIKAVVDGDTGIYDVLVIKEGNSNSISQWYCGCAWGRWAFKRKRSFVGRLCFVPGTKVTMADGTLKDIEEVQAGDLVRSHTGEARKVTSLVVNHHDDVVYGVHPRGHETIWATGEHPFYVRPHTDIKCQDCWDKGYQRSQCAAQGTKGHDHKNRPGEKLNPSWVEARDLGTNHWMSKTAPKVAERDVVFDLTEFCENYREDDQGRILRGNPTPQTGMRYRGNPVNRYVKLDNDLAYLFGLYLGDGSHPRGGTVGFHFGLNEQHLADEVTRIAGEKFGLIPQVHVGRSGRNIIDVFLTSAIITEFFHRYAGSGHAVKKLAPEILEAPASVLAHALRGWIDSDNACSVNRNMVFQMEQIALRNGISSSVTVTPASSQRTALVGDNTRDIYHLNCSPERDQKSQFFTNFVEGDSAWVRIQDVTTKHYHGPVFNLSVEVDETYQVNGFNTHNCSHAYASYLSMGQQPGGSVSSTKRQRTYPYYTGEPTPSGHLTLKRKRRRSSLLDEYKSWAKDENSGNIDIPSADDFLSQRDEIPTPTEAKAVYDYACENASERPTRSYDVDGYSFDPGDHWDSTKTADDNALLRSEAPPFRLTPDLYLVPDGEGQHFTDVESDDRKTTGPDQITAKVDKSWAKKQHDLDDDHDPIVRFSARRMALTYTADENLLNRLRDLSAETNAENAGHMREHNQEISEVIGELHERGYDANRLVASIRTADEGDWERTQDGGRTLFRQPGNNDGWAMEGDTFSPIRWDGGGTQGPEGGRYNMPGSGNKDFTHTQDSKGRDLFRTRGPGGLLAENPQGFAVNPNGNIDNVNFVGSGELGDSNNRFDLADGDRPISENFKNFLKGNPGLDMPSGDPAKPSDPADPAGTNTNSGGGGGGGGGTNSGGGGGGGGTNSGGGGGGGSGWSENGNTDPIGPGEYKIQTGDTYSNLAERAGWGSDYQGFANATGYNADNPDLIYAGDTMNVVAPPGAGETTPPAPGADPAAAPVGAPPPPAPGAPAPADSTSGTPAPDPGVGGSTGFAPPVTPAAPAPTNDAIAAPGATLTGDQLTNPGLTMQSARHRLAWSDHSDTDLINLHRQNKHPGLRADVAQELWDRASGDIETYGYSDLAGYLEQHGINPPKNRIDRNASRQFWATDDDDKPKADYKSWYPRADSGDAGGGEDQNPAPKAQGPGLNGDYPTGETPPAAPTAAPTSPRGVKDPGPGPEQMTTPNFNQRPGPQEPVPSDGSKKLEEQAPQGQSTGGGGDFDMSQMMPILNGVGSAIGPLVGPAVTGLTQGITDGLGTIGSGIGSAIGSGLSGLLSFAAYDPRDDPGDDADPTFSGTGPERKYWYTTSEDWVDDHERDGLQDLNEEPTGDMITYRRQQPRQAANTGWTPEMIEAWAAKHDSRRQPPREEINFIRDDRGDNDIVARFQRSAANSAINASPGGTFSDDAIAHAARGFLRTAGRVYSVAEQQELMDESHPKGARNLAGLDLSNTHYEDLSWS